MKKHLAFCLRQPTTIILIQTETLPKNLFGGTQMGVYFQSRKAKKEIPVEFVPREISEQGLWDLLGPAAALADR